MRCETCQGNGEIVTDWDRYLHAKPGDVGDESVSDCPDCDGTGEIEGEEGECYCDFASREFFGCFDRSHAPPCPQAERFTTKS